MADRILLATKYNLSKMEIVYKTDTTPTPEQVIELYNNSGLSKTY